MIKNRGVWFVMGFGFGFLALYVSLSLVPHLGPAIVEADETQVTTYDTVDHQSLAELGRLARRINERLDRCENETGSADASGAALKSDLQTVRNQIELYKVQHVDKHPGLDAVGKLDMANFTRRLTEKTDLSGALNPNGNMGPYLQRFPKNSFSDKNADQVSFGTAKVSTDAAGGWYFNTTTGRFSANDPGHTGW